MEWFKLYGQKLLTDSRIGQLDPLQRYMFICLLCLASQDETRSGTIKFLSESHLKILAGVIDNPFNDDWKRTTGTIETFCNIGLVTCPDDNTIIVTNYNKLQTQKATSTERVKRWRELRKGSNKAIKPMKRMKRYNETLHETNVSYNVTADKSRVDVDKNNSVIADKPQSYKRVSLEKATELQRVVYHLEDTLNTRITNWGKQAKAYSMMTRAGYTEDQIKKSITHMAKNDDFFSDKGFDLMTVSNNIPRLKAEAEKGARYGKS